MTNWHALPLELKIQILGAYVDCVVGDDSYVCRRDWSMIFIYHYHKSPPFVVGPAPKSDFIALLLVAPELRRELLKLIDKKLSGATVLSNCGVVSRLADYSLDGDLCFLSMLRQNSRKAAYEKTILLVVFALIVMASSCAHMRSWTLRSSTSRSGRLQPDMVGP